MNENPGPRLADLIRMPVGERRAELRGLVSKSENAAALKADLAAATKIGERRAPEQPLARGWQDRVLTRLRESEIAIENENQNARELLAKFLDLPHPRRETLARNTKRFHTWSFCQLLSRESVAILFRDPQDGLRVAQLAAEIAEDACLKAPSEALLNDVRGRCWTYLGNAQRALSLFHEAETSFAKASAYLRQGTGDPVEAAQLVEYRATLRLRQRRFPEAARLFDQAIRISLSIGDRHAAGVASVGKALLHLETGAVEESIVLNRQALEMLDTERGARVATIARHNLAIALKTMGAYAEAAEEIRKLKPAHSTLGDTISLLRLSYLEAEVEFGMGLSEQAVARLKSVREAFAAHGMAVDVGVATLDLAAFHLQLNQLSETKRLASESLPLFRSLGIHREAIAAFLVFQEAAEREAATVELVREIATYLRASRTNPELKFRA